jgi:hypothetical protein
MNKFVSLLPSLLLASLIACGADGQDGAGADGGNSRQGFTDCGNFPDQQPKTCNPGQYCADEGFSECELGCLGDYNCEAGRTCRKDPGQDVGSCDAAPSLPDAGTPTSNELERCLNACSTLTGCGAIDVGEGAQCTSDCNGLSDGQRKAVADCVGDWDCSGSIPACLGLECGPAYDCPIGGEQCIGGTCL